LVGILELRERSAVSGRHILRMNPSTLNLVPPAPFPRPLASEVDDILPVIVDEADLPARENSKDHGGAQDEPLPSHPQGVDSGEATADGGRRLSLNPNDDGLIRDSLTLDELRKYVEGGPSFKAKVRSISFSADE
jgi:hypothetical protein